MDSEKQIQSTRLCPENRKVEKYWGQIFAPDGNEMGAQREGKKERNGF